MISNIRPYLHLKPIIGNSVFIDPTAVVIGDVHISDNVSVWPLTVIRGDVNYISIGARTNIQDGSVLHVTHENKLNPRDILSLLEKTLP